MRTVFEPKRNRYSFDSLREFGLWIDATEPNWTARQSTSNKPEMSWDLNAGYDGAVQMAKLGWIAGAQRMQGKLKVLQARQPMPRKRVDFVGYTPHVPRYCAGAPDCMIRKQGDNRGGKSLVLYVDICVSAFQNAEHLANYGTAIAHYVKQLELDGTRCEVHAGATVTLKGIKQTFTVCVKRAGQPLDLAVMAYAVGHTAFFRRLWFAFSERAKAPYQSGYGSISKLALADCISPAATAVVLHGMNRAHECARTPLEAVESVRAEIERKTKKG